MTRLDRAALRSAVGEENFPDLEAICNTLDRLGCRLAVSGEGLDRIMAALAEELAIQRMAHELADCGLSPPFLLADTPPSEDL